MPDMQRLKPLCDGTPVGVLVGTLFAVALAWSTGDLAQSGQATFWLAGFGLAMCARLWFWHGCRRQLAGPRPVQAAKWLFLFRLGLFGSGLLWGLAGLLLIPPQSGITQVFGVAVLLGVSSSGLGWLAADRVSMWALTVPALLGLALGIARVGGEVATLMVPGIVIYGLFLLYNAEKINRQFNLIRQQTTRLDGDREQIVRLSRVASQTTNGVLITNPDGRTVWTNPGLTRMLGYSPDEMLGRQPFRMLVGRATNPATVDRLVRVFREGEADQQDLQLKTRSGDFIWVRAQISPIRDEHGTLINYMGLLSDITAEKEVGAALDNYVQALAALTDLAADPSLDIDAQLNQALDLGRRFLAMDLAMIVRVHGPKLEAEYVRGNGSIALEPGAKSMLVGTLVEAVLDARTTVRIADVQNCEAGPRCLFDGAQCRSFAGYPLELSDRSVRVICVAARELRAERFSGREKVFLDLLFQWVLGVLESRARQDQVEKLVAQVPGMVYQFKWMPDGTMCIPYSSPGMREMYGIDPAEVAETAEPILHKLHPLDEQVVRDSIVRSASDLSVWEEEHRVVDADGSVRWLHGIARPEALPDGGVLWHGYIRDISERKKSEVALQENEQRLRALFELTPVGIVLNDVHSGTFMDVNRRFERLTGFDAQELCRMKFSDLCPSDDVDRDREYVSQLLRGKEQVAYERPMLRRDGSSFIARMHSTVLEAADGKRLIWTLIEDVTAQRQMEQELRDLNDELEARVDARTREVRRESIRTAMIVSVARDGFLMHDEAGCIHRVNPALCRLLGMQAGELVGKSIADLAPDTTPEALQRGIAKVRDDGSAIFETRFRRSDGTILDLEVSVGSGDCEESTWFYAFLRDIGERKRAEQALRRAKRDAEQASAAKTEFLSRMSHELRTPLNAILGFSQLLKTDPAFPERSEQYDSLSEIFDAGKHLLNLVDEVLDLSRIEQGRLDLRMETVRLLPLVQECMALIKPIADERDIAVDSAVESTLKVRADRTRLKEVLLNLVSNAVKYNRPGGTVSITTTESAPGKIHIEVADTGRGIAKDQLDRLFRPFERLGSALDGIEGTGIGLALAKRLTEVMGGVIGVESAAGKGSRFWVGFRKAESVSTTTDAGQSDDTADATAVPGGGDTERMRRRLLYIEDNPSNMRLVRRALGTRPHLQLLEAIDGETGLELARTQSPDLILLDLNLPGRDGLSVLGEIRSDAALSGIPVVAVTANAMDSDREAGLEAGLDAYVTKPISIAEFVQTIEQVLARFSEKA